MKKKRITAAILAMVLTITLMPCMASAQTGAYAEGVGSSVLINDILPQISVDFKFLDETRWVNNTIRISFTNAEWATKQEDELYDMMSVSDRRESSYISRCISMGENWIEMTIENMGDAWLKNDSVKLTFARGALRAGDEAGTVKMYIDGLNSAISSAEFTVAQVITNGTEASVKGTVNTIDNCNAKLLDGIIEIRETAVNAIEGNQVLRLKLPNGYVWDDVLVNGDLFKTDHLSSGLVSDLEVDDQEDLKKTSAVDGNWYKSGRDLYLYLEYAGSDEARNVVTIQPCITAGQNATVGDITVDVTTYWTGSGRPVSDASDLVVAKYGEVTGTPVISMGECRTRQERTVTMDLDLKNNPGISYLRLTIKTAEGVTLSDVENGTILKDLDNGLNLLWSANENSDLNGVLATLKFDVAENAPIGDSQVEVLLRECYNEDGDDIQIEVTNGMIHIIDFIYGDVNDDDVVNGKDVLLMRKYLANYDDDTQTSSVTVFDGADANGDGVLNGKDLLLLRKYMANYDDDTGTSSVVLGSND